MITFLLGAASWLLGLAPPLWVFVVAGLVDGLVFLPLLTYAFVPILGRIGREKVGRLYGLLMVQPVEAIALCQTGDGYQWADASGGVARLPDGREYDLDDDRTEWYRLNKTPLAIIPLPEADVFEAVGGDPEDWTLRATTDDVGLLDRQRGGQWGYTPFPDGTGEGIVVSLTKAINGLRGAAGAALSEQAEKEAKETGGDSGFSAKTRAGLMLAAMVMGVVVSLGVFVF